MLLEQLACRAFSRAWAKTGKRIAAKMAMIAITTSSSISVKPCRFFIGSLLSLRWLGAPPLVGGGEPPWISVERRSDRWRRHAEIKRFGVGPKGVKAGAHRSAAVRDGD